MMEKKDIDVIKKFIYAFEVARHTDHLTYQKVALESEELDKGIEEVKKIIGWDKKNDGQKVLEYVKRVEEETASAKTIQEKSKIVNGIIKLVIGMAAGTIIGVAGTKIIDKAFDKNGAKKSRRPLFFD